MTEKLIVVPCYNECSRIDYFSFKEFLLHHSQYQIYFVDDGSLDGTADFLDQKFKDCSQVKIIRLKKNVGKAEAVRTGISLGLERGFQFVAFLDADLATPISEVSRIISLLANKSNNVHCLIGARVLMSGFNIKRNPVRHYLGRIFATCVGVLFPFTVYDSQCGCKVFRNNDVIRNCFAEKFQSTWVFDVELLARLYLHVGSEAFHEVPLLQWHDVGKSKVKWYSFAFAFVDLCRVYLWFKWVDAKNKSHRT